MILNLRAYASAIMLTLGVALSLTSSIEAKVVNCSSGKQFDTLRDKKPFTVVMFYYKHKKKDDRAIGRGIHFDERTDVSGLYRLFDDMSAERLYRDGNVQFVRINIADKDCSDVATDFGVGRVPAWILFNRGMPVRTKQGKVEVLAGDTVTYKSLRSFIDQGLRDDIEDYLERKSKAREDRDRDSGAAVYFGYGAGYGYPYYGYPYYGYGPGVGVGFGFSF